MKDLGPMHYFLGCCFIWGQPWRCGKAGSNSLWFLVRQKQNTLQHAPPVVKPYIWLRKLLIGLFDLEMEATMILRDNQSSIKMTENPVFHDKTKHKQIRYLHSWHGAKESCKASICWHIWVGCRCVD
jgi:hypothetical protein